MRRSIYFLLLLPITLSACQSAEPGSVAPEPEAQVENWQSTEATVTARVYGDAGAAVVATGTVSAAGELTFRLEPPTSAQLVSFAACPGVAISDETLKLGSFSAFEVAQGETAVGQLAQVSRLEVTTGGLQQAGDYYLQYTYADRDANVSGRCQESSPATFSYALTLKKGWNPVVFKLIKDGMLELSTTPVPADATWFFSEAGQ